MSIQPQNGRADLVGTPIQLGDFLPERRQVVLNGQPYQAWVTTNKRYPRTIMARLDRAARAYNQVILPILEQTETVTDTSKLSPEKLHALDMQPEAWEQYISECVVLLVPGLLESEVELVDLPTLEGLLRELGYLPDNENAEKPATEENQGNDPLTGATPQDVSPTSTQVTRPKRN